MGQPVSIGLPKSAVLARPAENWGHPGYVHKDLLVNRSYVVGQRQDELAAAGRG